MVSRKRYYMIILNVKRFKRYDLAEFYSEITYIFSELPESLIISATISYTFNGSSPMSCAIPSNLHQKSFGKK